MKRKFTKYPVMGSSMTQEFMKYHDSAENYHSNKDGFNQMYTILDQYGSDDEDVDVVFDRATEEDKKRMLELIKPVTGSDYLTLKYTFYFGDGNSAASRGSEVENDCKISGTVSWDEMASAAVAVLNKLPDNFIDADILDALFDEGYSAEDIEALQNRSLEDAIAQLDISGGEPLVYRVEKNGQAVYEDANLEELVKSGDQYIESASEVGVRSGYSFDFIHDGNYNEKAIREVIEDSFDRMALELVGMDFESVDYSSYPDYADKCVSQCQVTFGWEGDYDGNAITDMIEQRLAQLGYEVIGNDFYSI